VLCREGQSLPKTHIHPEGFLSGRRADAEEYWRNRVITYEGEEAQKWDRFNAAMVSFMYLHWLETGASPAASRGAFRKALERGELLDGLDLGDLLQGDKNTLPQTLPSGPMSGQDEGI
jgi:hypothetical protein